MSCSLDFDSGRGTIGCNIYRSTDAGKVSDKEKGVMDGFCGSGEGFR